VTLPELSTAIASTTSPSVCVCRAIGGYSGITLTRSLGSFGPALDCTGALTRRLEDEDANAPDEGDGNAGALGFTGDAMPASGSALAPGVPTASRLGAAIPSARRRVATGWAFSAAEMLGTIFLGAGAGVGPGALAAGSAAG
jgi:hypothetical protein